VISEYCHRAESTLLFIKVTLDAGQGYETIDNDDDYYYDNDDDN